jgi:hypothetical protein
MFKKLIVAIALALVFVAPVSAQDSTLPPSPIKPTATPAPTAEPTIAPTDVPDLPPGFGGEDFDIVVWLTGLLGAGGGLFVAWLLEKTRLSIWLSQFNPEVKRQIAIALSGLVGLAAYCLLGLITSLPIGAVAVINALIAMITSQLGHGTTLKKARGS